jgi:carbon-monoxide dehydrogenase medium subunit/2-furoyl-CoA dehydrogenase FAD binding subunit
MGTQLVSFFTQGSVIISVFLKIEKFFIWIGAIFMKAAQFDYHLADSLTHAKELLDNFGQDVKLIAGGQSLVPMMAMRLAKPGHLVDIHRLTELKEIKTQGSYVRTGSMVRQCTIEHASLGKQIPLFGLALPWIGHQQTRNRGTIGGSLAHADPSAELPLIAVMLNAQLTIEDSHQQRVCDAKDFFLGPMWTNLEANECLTHIDWPIWDTKGTGASFHETAIRQGDFAMASAATQLQINEAGLITQMTFGIGGMGGTPYSFDDLSHQAIGKELKMELIHELSHSAIKRTEPASDLHAGADYRRSLATKLLEKSMREALELAKQNL